VKILIWAIKAIRPKVATLYVGIRRTAVKEVTVPITPEIFRKLLKEIHKDIRQKKRPLIGVLNEKNYLIEIKQPEELSNENKSQNRNQP